MIKNGRYCVNGTVQPKTYKKNLYYFSGGTNYVKQKTGRTAYQLYGKFHRSYSKKITR